MFFYIVIGIAILLVLSYIGLIFVYFKLKNFKIALVLILVPFILYGGLVIYGYIYSISYKTNIYSLNYKQEETLYDYDTERDFHGDGYSIKVDSISKSDIDYFKNIDFEILKKYPLYHYHSNEYRIERWKKTPFDLKDTLPCWLAFHHFGKIILNGLDEGNKFNKYSNMAQQFLSDSGNYYSYFFYEHPYGCNSVDLFIISPKNAIIIEINNQ